MTSDDKDRARDDRLAAALRDNLKRRKAQGRSQAAADDPAAGDPPAEPAAD
jgi:hypothetical protein